MREKAHSGSGKTMRSAHWQEAITRLEGLLAGLKGGQS